MELHAEFFKRAEHYSLPNPTHCVKVKVRLCNELRVAAVISPATCTGAADTAREKCRHV